MDVRKTKGALFDPEIHVSRPELEQRYGQKGGSITRRLRKHAVLAAGAIIDRRRSGNIDVPFWERDVVISLLDLDFGLKQAETTYRGQIVPPAEVRKFKPLKTSSHPRMADINSSQPTMGVTMGGVGNGQERTHGFSRGS